MPMIPSLLLAASAVGPVRTTASRIQASGGWYDAGDYGKYLPSSAISTWSLLHLYSAGMIGWGDVRTLGLLALSREAGGIPTASAKLGANADSMLVHAAQGIRDARDLNGYHLPDATFKWSSNTVFANNGFVCWNAWRITRDTSFRSAAIDMLDYLLGRNATGYSFVTGFGAKTPMNPHHRISTGDGVTAPIPGMLVGGPNPGQEDGCPGYPSTLAPKSYVDAVCSYASNEPAINQNAAMILLAGSLSAELVGWSPSALRSRDAQLPISVSIFGRVLRVRVPVVQPVDVEVFGLDGRRSAFAAGSGGVAEVVLAKGGIWLVRARSAGQTWTNTILAP